MCDLPCTLESDSIGSWELQLSVALWAGMFNGARVNSVKVNVNSLGIMSDRDISRDVPIVSFTPPSSRNV